MSTHFSTWYSVKCECRILWWADLGCGWVKTLNWNRMTKYSRIAGGRIKDSRQGSHRTPEKPARASEKPKRIRPIRSSLRIRYRMRMGMHSFITTMVLLSCFPRWSGHDICKLSRRTVKYPTAVVCVQFPILPQHICDKSTIPKRLQGRY